LFIWWILLGVVIGSLVTCESLISRFITYMIRIGSSEENAFKTLRLMLRLDYKFYKNRHL